MGLAISQAIMWFANLLTILIFARVILSWFAMSSGGSFLFNIVAAFTEPFIGPIRKIINRSPLGGGMIDFSPMIALMLIRVLSIALANAVIGL